MLLPSADALVFIKYVVAAHREFLRIADVTDRISEYKTCFWDTVRRVDMEDGNTGMIGHDRAQLTRMALADVTLYFKKEYYIATVG